MGKGQLAALERLAAEHCGCADLRVQVRQPSIEASVHDGHYLQHLLDGPEFPVFVQIQLFQGSLRVRGPAGGNSDDGGLFHAGDDLDQALLVEFPLEFILRSVQRGQR